MARPRIPWGPVIWAAAYGSACALLINVRAANYAWIIVGVMVLHVLPAVARQVILGWLGGACEDASRLERAARIVRPVLVFLCVAAAGAGIFAWRMHRLVQWVDGRRSAIEAAVASGGGAPIDGVFFSPMAADGVMDIEPCWSQEVIVYHHGADCTFVLPLTRPLPISMSSFAVLMWDKGRGWRKDDIHWSIIAREPPRRR